MKEITGINHVGIRVADLDIEITEEPVTLPDGEKTLFIRDPDRNVIELHQDPVS